MSSADEMYAKNEATIMHLLDAYQSGNVDYSMYYADSAMFPGTGFKEDTVYNLESMMARDKEFLSAYSLELMKDSSLIVLPGVDRYTKKPDGSVRYYGTWKVTRKASDSLPEKSAMFHMYETMSFNADGKITSQSSYGDFSGFWQYMMAKE